MYSINWLSRIILVYGLSLVCMGMARFSAAQNTLAACLSREQVAVAAVLSAQRTEGEGLARSRSFTVTQAVERQVREIGGRSLMLTTVPTSADPNKLGPVLSEARRQRSTLLVVLSLQSESRRITELAGITENFGTIRTVTLILRGIVADVLRREVLASFELPPQNIAATSVEAAVQTFVAESGYGFSKAFIDVMQVACDGHIGSVMADQYPTHEAPPQETPPHITESLASATSSVVRESPSTVELLHPQPSKFQVLQPENGTRTHSPRMELVSPLARASRGVALVVGNAAYHQEARLASPVQDAQRMQALLERAGFDVILVADAGKKQMEHSISEFARRLERNGGVGWFYYSGHGQQIGGVNYLVPVDAQIHDQFDVEGESVRLGRVLDGMAGRGQVNVVILDACRNNPFKTVYSKAIGDKGLARDAAPDSTLILYATKPGQTAKDSSLFSRELVEALSRPGVDIEMLFRQVVKSVLLGTNGQQYPWKEGGLIDPFVLIPEGGTSSLSPTFNLPAPDRLAFEPVMVWTKLGVSR